MTKKTTTVIKSDYPHVLLWQASGWALEQGKNTKEGSALNFLSCMLTSAFCMEAFLNLVCREKISYWDLLEQKLNAVEKLDVLCKEIGFSLDKSERPFQTFNDLIRFRNATVHAKPMIDQTFEDVDMGSDGFPENFDKLLDKNTQWMSMCNEANAQRFYDDVTKMAEILYKKAGHRFNPFAVAGSSSWWGDSHI